MNVLMVNHAGQLGGAELSLVDLAAARPGQEVVVLEDGPLLDRLRAVGARPRLLAGGTMMGVRRDSSLWRASRVAPALARTVIRLAAAFRRADVIYANSQKAFVLSALAARLARRPLVWHLHDILTADHFSGAMRRVAVGLSNRCAHTVIVNSAATRAAYRAAGGRVPTVVIHNGIDPQPFAVIDRAVARAVLTAETGSGTAPLIGVIGRLSPWKGQHVAIRALALLPRHHLALIGGAFENDASIEAELRTLAAREDVADRVHFLGFRSDIAAIMGALDVVVHTSTAPEPFGRVIVEGMMAGRPVVATAAGGALEIVSDGATGLLVPPGDERALAAALHRLDADPPAAAALATRGAAHALAQFSLAGSVERINWVLDAAAVR